VFVITSYALIGAAEPVVQCTTLAYYKLLHTARCACVTGATEALLERAQLEREKADALKAGGGAVAKSGAAWRDEPVST
jgi:hypothetical protein